MEKSDVFVGNLNKVMAESSRWGLEDTGMSFSGSDRASDELKKEDLNIKKISKKYMKEMNAVESLHSYIMVLFSEINGEIVI